MNKDLEGVNREIFVGTIHTFAWKGWAKPRNISCAISIID